MKDFKIRASATGMIMSLPKTKAAKEAGELSKTSQTYIQDWMKEQMFDRKKDFSNKYTIKGIDVEDKAIEIYGKEIKKDFKKNEEKFENEYATGTPDLIAHDCIIDIKSSWNVWTFPLFDDIIKNKLYMYQLQTYMWLTGKTEAKLVYVLVDTPDEQILKEFHTKKWDVLEENRDGLLEIIIKDLSFEDINVKHKIKVFSIKRDDDIIEQIKERVIACRAYQKQLNLFI